MLLYTLIVSVSLAAQSVADLKALTEKEPQNGGAWFRLGDALLADGQAEAAVPAFLKARQLGFQPPVAAERMVRAWVAAKKNDEALKQLERMAQGGFAGAPLVESDNLLAPIRADARYAAAMKQIKTNGAPCEFNETYKQFDFWVGDWAVYGPAGRLSGTNKIEKLLNGCLIVENWTGAAGMTGKSMNFYDSTLKQWRQVWVDASGTVSQVAGNPLSATSMRLSGTGKNAQGEFLRRMTVSKLENGNVRQLWEQSRDNGATWTAVFDGTYKKRTNETLPAKQLTACAAATYRKFDFWVGEWEVHPPNAVNPNPPLSSIRNTVDGCMIYENWMPKAGGDGKSFNFFDPNDSKWHQVWVASGSGVIDMVGDFDGKVLRYEGVIVQANGIKALQRLAFSPLEDGRVRQFWEQSTDGGKTWTVSFDGYYKRRS